MKTITSERGRSVIVRCTAGERLPEVLLEVLREERVTAGWIRGSGVLEDVEIRAFDPSVGGHAASHRLSGAVQVISVEGSVGVAHSQPSLGLRAVIARETDRGLETLGGEIVTARVLGFEAVITAFDDLALGRALDRAAGVTLFEGDESTAPRETTLAREAPKPVPKSPPGAWADAVRASEEEEAVRPAPRASGSPTPSAVVPPRPARATSAVDDSPFPDAGDIVEHFAFGRCEVLKSDGDRLHLKVGKDGRVREIALEMLRVTELDSNGPHRRFKLDRKL